MGLGSSRLGSRPSRPRVNRRNHRLAPFICGGSSSQPTHEMEDHPVEILANSGGHHDSIVDNSIRSSVEESSLILSSENECSSSTSGSGTSCGRSSGILEEITIQKGSRSLESYSEKCLSESKELVRCQENDDYNLTKCYFDRTSDVASSSKELQPLESASLNMETSLATVAEVDDSTIEGGSQVCTEGFRSSSISQPELGDSCADGAFSIENSLNEARGIRNSNPNSVSVVSDSLVTWQSLGDESVREAAPPGPEFLVPPSQRDRRNGSVLHVDVVSISSNILASTTEETSNREARRNSRRLFWDAFSRRSSRRHSDSPTLVFATEDTDDFGSHDRWLLDFSGDLFDNGVGNDSGYLGSRSHGAFERRRHSRSEIWERIRGGLDESSGRTAFCASGLHPDGTCSCESFLMTEESGTRASISRIVMLAEALFEVLDEIHRQPVSLSLSMVSVPAPESVVNSFPLKSHKRHAIAESVDVEQCYICLAEYEEGDKIRVLPCRHEYHMSCVDKWLKEIHGVCPLCRGDVCEGVSMGSVSNS